VALLVELVEENFQVLMNKKTSQEMNDRKKFMWTKIAQQVSAQGQTTIRTWEQCRDKWHKLSSNGKSFVSKKRREAAKTGGGPPGPEEGNPIMRKLEEINQGNPSWYGIRGGAETKVPEAAAGSSSAAAMPEQAATPGLLATTTVPSNSDGK